VIGGSEHLLRKSKFNLARLRLLLSEHSSTVFILETRFLRMKPSLASGSPGQPRRPLGKIAVFLAVVLVSVVAVVAYEWMSGGGGGNDSASTSSGAQTGEAIFIQVVNASTMAPIGGMPVYAGPTPSPNDVLNTGGGPTLAQCGIVVPNGASVGNGKVVLSNGTTSTFTISCPLVEYKTDAFGRVSITNVTGPFYFVKAGGVNSWNDMVVGVEANTVINMTIPLPSGEMTTPWSSGGTRQALPFLWPNTSIVWPCGEALPNNSTATPQGVYAGQYVAYSYAALPNGTAAAIAGDCPSGLSW
jgi:hypothetical protein